MKKDTLEVAYKHNNNHNTFPISGIAGGRTPSGDIKADLFYESLSAPVKTSIELEDGLVVKEKIELSKIKYVREISMSIVVNSNTARSIGEWFLKQAAEMEKE